MCPLQAPTLLGSPGQEHSVGGLRVLSREAAAGASQSPGNAQEMQAGGPRHARVRAILGQDGAVVVKASRDARVRVCRPAGPSARPRPICSTAAADGRRSWWAPLMEACWQRLAAGSLGGGRIEGWERQCDGSRPSQSAPSMVGRSGRGVRRVMLVVLDAAVRRLREKKVEGCPRRSPGANASSDP